MLRKDVHCKKHTVEHGVATLCKPSYSPEESKERARIARTEVLAKYNSYKEDSNSDHLNQSRTVFLLTALDSPPSELLYSVDLASSGEGVLDKTVTFLDWVLIGLKANPMDIE